MKVYTNCSSCSFLKNEKCSLGKWETPGFKDLVIKRPVDSGAEEYHIEGRFCQFHRVEKWASSQADPINSALESAKLDYGFVTGIDKNSDTESVFKQIDMVCRSKHPPKNLYFISNKKTENLTKSEIEKRLSVYNIPYRIKMAIIEMPMSKFIDELCMVEKLTNSFYLCALKTSLDINFINGLDVAINHNMRQVMYAGDENYYFMPTKIHKLCKDNFKQFLIKEGLGESVFSYDDIIKESALKQEV